MSKNKGLHCFLIALVCFFAVSCGVNDFSDLSFSLDSFSRAGEEDVVSETLVIKVFDAVTHEIILQSPDITVTDYEKEYTMEGIPTNRDIYVYMNYVLVKKNPQTSNGSGNETFAWSAKSDVFTLLGGEQKRLPMELVMCPYIMFKCTGHPDVDDLYSNNITFCAPGGQTPYSYWYATFSLHSKDGRTKNQVMANGEPDGVLYCAEDNNITVPFFIDANEDCDVTINCYSVTQEQALILYSKADSDTVAEVVKNGPTYTFYKELTTPEGNGQTVVIDVPLKQ